MPTSDVAPPADAPPRAEPGPPGRGLRDFLVRKRAALLDLEAQAAADPAAGPVRLRAQCTAEGQSGVRRIRIRDHQLLSDSPPNFAGHDLGPSSPELQLGVLASCVAHIFEIIAARERIPLDELRVEVEGEMAPRGATGYPREPHNIRYQVLLTSPAPAEQIDALHRAVEEECPLLALLSNPQTISGSVVHTPSR